VLQASFAYKHEEVRERAEVAATAEIILIPDDDE
jgi:hypothetical protein